MLKLIEKKIYFKQTYKIEIGGYWGDDDLEGSEEYFVDRTGTQEEKEKIDKKIENVLKFWYDNDNHDDDDFRDKFSEMLDELGVYLPYSGIYDRYIDVLGDFFVTYYDENGKEYRVSID